MKLPKFARPVKRPEVIPPHLTVDLLRAWQESRQEYNRLFQNLVYGANFNDPPYFQYRTYQQLKFSSGGCGCFRCSTGRSCRCK